MGMAGWWVFWLFMITVRVMWTLWPQASYIHPDEFFQTVEVGAGKTLDIQVERTWEFAGENPLRSTVLSSFLFQPCFRLLQHLSKELGIISLTGAQILRSSRLVMLLLSFWVDFCVYLMCKIIGVQSNKANILLTSSHVMLTFQVHSFSNSLETVFVTTEVLLIIVIVKQYMEEDYQCDFKTALIDKVVEMLALKGRQTENLGVTNQLSQLHKSVFSLRNRTVSGNKMSEPAKTGSVVDRLEFSADADVLVSKYMMVNGKSSRRWTMHVVMVTLSFVNTVGVFNRPTFALFVMGPFLWWFDISQFSSTFFKHMTVFIVSSLLSVIGFVLLDTSFYLEKSVYAILSDLDLEAFKNFTQTFKITPYNFIVYNSSPANLESHGLHSPCIHLLVNMPLLFGPMLIPIGRMLYKELREWFRKWRGSSSEKPNAENNSNSDYCDSDDDSDPNDEDSGNIRSYDGSGKNRIDLAENIESEDCSEGNVDESTGQAEEILSEKSHQVKQDKSGVMTAGIEYAENVDDGELNFVEIMKDEEMLDNKDVSRVIGKGLKLIRLKVDKKLQQDLKKDLLLFIMFPVLALSAFPHQEARFLIPLLPLVTITLNLECRHVLGKGFWSLFFVFNIVLGLVFGVLHQGGVVPCLLRLQKISQEHLLRNPRTELHIVFSHTYMPPKHLLLLPNESLVNVTDFRGQDLNTVCEHLKQKTNLKIINFNSTQSNPSLQITNKKTIYLALTGTLVKDFRNICRKSVNLKIVAKFFPHLSFEELPNPAEIHTSNWQAILSLYLFQIT